MRRRFNASYVLIPLIYALIIFLLVILQFSGGKLFNATIGPINLSGAFDMGGAPESKQIASIRVQVQGIQFLFDREHPLRIQNQDENFTDLKLTGYQQTEKGFDLNFEHGVELNYQYADETKSSAQISVQLPSSLTPLKSVRMSYSTAGEATLSQGVPGVELNYQGATYVLSLPPRSFVDKDRAQLVIPGDASKSLRISQKASDTHDIFDDTFQAQVAGITEKDYRGSVDEFIGTAYNGWKSSRFNSANGTWSFRDGENRFNEEIMVDVLAEAWYRNEYTRVYNDMRTSADSHPNQLTHRSAVYLGNLRRITNELTVQDRQESNRISGLIEKKNPDLFMTPGLFQFALDRGEAGLATSLIKFANEIPLTDLNPIQALGLLQNRYLGNLPDPSLETSLSRFDALVKDVVIPNVIRVDEGYFYQSRTGMAESYYSVLAGRILQEAGARMGDERIAALGRSMVLSVIKLADDLGYLHEEIEFAGGAISAMRKSVGPEDVYWMLQQNPNYPKYVSLYPQVGAGAWFYTIAEVDNVAIDSQQYKFTISYARSRTHFVFFRGMHTIDPQQGMQLFGIIWRNAPDFEIYSKGRYYNPDTRTLMIKYFDDSVQKDIVIYNR